MANSNIQRATSGFITFALSILGIIIFTFWSILPEHVLQSVGFSYYPNRYWSVAAPSLFTVLLSYFLFYHFCAYMRNTKPLDDMFLLTDSQSKEATPEKNLFSSSTSVRPLADIPVTMTSVVLHQPWPVDAAEQH